VTFEIRILPEAEDQARAVAEWWRANRPAAPELVKQELRQTFGVLAETPYIGSPYLRTPVPGVRRYPLKKTPYHVYYRVNEEAGEVIVLSVWSAMRGHGPPLQAGR
jgi:plasmid stabilization system protein ParE